MSTPRKPLPEVVRHFTPSWFATLMGVGVQVSLLHNFPFNGGHQYVLDVIATVILIFDIVVFLTMTLITVARYVMYPEIWGLMLNHPVQSLFVGCYPMALAGIVNGLIIEAHTRWKLGGDGFLYFIWSLWWLDVGLSLASNFGMFYIMVTRHKLEWPTASAVLLLPIVPSIVAGTSGAIVANALIPVSTHYAFLTTLVSCFLLALGLSMSMVILAMYTHRLLLIGFPNAVLATTVLLPLGPLGQGGYGLLLLVDLFRELLPNSTSAGDFLAVPGIAEVLAGLLFITAFLFWVFGTWFIIPGITHLTYTEKAPFALPYWGLIFPFGVYTLLTIQLGTKLNSTFIHAIGTIYTIAVFALFVFCFIRTLHKLPSGSLFYAPCLDGIRRPLAKKVETNADPIQNEATYAQGDPVGLGFPSTSV